MNTPSCPNHGEMKWKEGFSKTTGKPYAFWTCPTKMPDGSWCPVKGPKGGPSASAPAPQPVSNASLEVLERIDSKLALVVNMLNDISTKNIPF